ncbi:alkaline phytoceramidase [Stipitochalara longipes BDJ]|nr:alkaline phytoceramidase [Stipitochalara longipes BDJ]
MPFYLPAFPYPPAGEGYWGARTSTINWCEEDYYATMYSAEIVNTATNLIFVFLAYKGISSCIRHGHERVFLIGFLGYLSIGVGSMCFHSSLKYPMQLLDELSMIYTTCIMVYALFSHRQSTRACIAIFLALLGLAVFITGYYHYLQDPKFHQNMFALLTIVVTLRSMWLMEFLLRPSRRPKRGVATSVDNAEQARGDRRDEGILKTMWAMYACGLSACAIGFLIWKLDNIFCGTLRRWRRDVGLPWGILLEGHGWWHLFTGVAGYFNLTRLIWLRYCLDGEQDNFELAWPSVLTSVPVVARVEDKKKKLT